MANAQWIYSAGTNSIEWKCRAIVDQSNQSITNNTSDITVTFQFTRARSSSYASNGATTTYITIDGTQYSISVPSYNYGYIGVDDWKTIATKTITVTHDSIGDKTCPISCSWSQSGVQPNSCSVSGSPSLTRIPRASAITCNDANIGASTTINISRANSTFTHTLTYNFSGLTGTIATKTTSISVGWTIPTSFFAKIPNAKSGVVTITCETFNGTTSLGTKTCTATCSVVNSNPSVTATVIDVNTIATDLTGDTSKLIKGVSIAKVTTSATGLNSATISSIQVSCADGKSGIGATVTLNSVTSPNFTIKVTDSRGFITTITKTLTLVDYVFPAVTELSIGRLETSSPLTKITVKGNIWSGSFGSQTNARQLSYFWRENGTTAWSSEIILTPTTVSETTFTYEANLNEPFDINKSFEYIVRIKDKVTQFDKSTLMGRSIPLITAYNDKINIAGGIEMSGIPIISRGTNTNGDYIQYADGTLICIKGVVSQQDCTTSWGNSYYTPRFTLGSWAMAFKESPRVYATNGNGTSGMLDAIRSTTSTIAGDISIIRPASTTASNFAVYVMGIGRWT